jgi:aspartate oxidase
VRERLASGLGAGDRAATLVAWFVAGAALEREESRGGHFRVDFPSPRAEWRVRQAVDRHGRWTIGIPGEQNVLRG